MFNKGVTFVREEIKSLLPEWEVIRDCIAGEKTVKDAGFKYLPYPSTEHDCTQNEMDAVYQSYKKRATFLSVTRKSVYELTGQIFVKPPTLAHKDDPIINALIKNATGDGVSFIGLAKSVLKQVIAYNYCGLFIDYPYVEGVLSKADVETGKYRPTISMYSCFEIVNFRVEPIGTEDKVTLVVLKETANLNQENGFEVKGVEQYRVLRLVDGEYIQELWRKKDIDENYISVEEKVRFGSDFVLHKTIKPLDLNGKPFNYIPFMFIGGENNNPYPDKPIMYDLAALNISHYRNSADYEEALFITGQPTLVLVGAEDGSYANKGDVRLGSRQALLVKNGGSGTLLQMKSDTGLEKALERKEKLMANLNAKFLEPKQIQMTAYQVRVENQANGSILSDCADNVSEAFLWALKEVHSVLGLDESDIQFKLNTDFAYNRMSTDEQQFFVNMYLQKAIAFTEMRSHLTRTGTAYLSDDEAIDEIVNDKIRAAEAEILTQKGNQDEPKEKSNQSGV